MIKVYPCCALTHAPAADIELVAKLKEKLAELDGIEVLPFLEFPNPAATAPGDVYRRDIDCVRQTDVLLAIYIGEGGQTVTSDGRGYEIATAVEGYNKKPVIIVSQRGSEITHLITNLTVIYPELVSLHVYDDLLRDVPEILKRRLMELWPTGFADLADSDVAVV